MMHSAPHIFVFSLFNAFPVHAENILRGDLTALTMVVSTTSPKMMLRRKFLSDANNSGCADSVASGITSSAPLHGLLRMRQGADDDWPPTWRGHAGGREQLCGAIDRDAAMKYGKPPA
jgi:hypothetical protein